MEKVTLSFAKNSSNSSLWEFLTEFDVRSVVRFGAEVVGICEGGMVVGQIEGGFLGLSLPPRTLTVSKLSGQ